MTTEEKAKAYDDALEKAKKMYNSAKELGFDVDVKNLETIFPELAELKGERIRKVLIDYFKSYREVGSCGSETFNGIPTDNILGWLEKQGKQKPYGQRQECVDCQFNYAGECKGYCTMKKDEQKSADKVEPKFKVGDFIINEFHDICLITNIDLENSHYLCESNHFGNIDSDIDLTDKASHLWTIQDAKDGDVLVASDSSIFLFKCVIDCGCKYYVALTTDNTIEFNEGLEHCWESSRAVHPATKEQRELLFKKMKEAGYTFDLSLALAWEMWRERKNKKRND